MEYRSDSHANTDNNDKKKRKTFSYEEDQKLMKLIEKYGIKSWKFISSKMNSRSARQCRERWKFYLSPNVNHSPWTPEEDHILFEKYNMLGPKWSIISKCFQNRSLNNVKNRWNSIMRKTKVLNLDVNSEEDFYYCGRLVTKGSPGFIMKINKMDKEMLIEQKTDEQIGPQFDPLYFFQINNLLNQPNTV